MTPYSPYWPLRIGEEAAHLLPRCDLLCFRAFTAGFDLRLMEVGAVSSPTCEPPRDFAPWVRDRYRAGGELEAATVVQLHSRNDAAALRAYCDLLRTCYGVDRAARAAFDVPPHKVAAKVRRVDRRQLLGAILRRPRLYLQGPLLTSLCAWLAGDRYALGVLGLACEETPDLAAVDAFARARHGQGADCDARQILLLHHGYDEEAAFRAFFECLHLAGQGPLPAPVEPM